MANHIMAAQTHTHDHTQRSALATRALWGALLSVLVATMGNCASAVPSPRVAVVGVDRKAASSQPVTLFLEVINPTSVPLVLRKLSYRIESEAASNGETVAADRGEPASSFSEPMSVTSTRTVLPGHSVFIEVPAIVPDAGLGARYTLHGTLEGTQNNQRRTFKMQSAIAHLGYQR